MDFCLCPVAYTFGYFMVFYYCIKFKSWMKYCACWNCDDMLLGMLIPIPISVYLHRTNILRFNNQISSSYNLCFDPKLDNDVCAIFRIPCNYVSCTSMLDKPWISGIPSDKK